MEGNVEAAKATYIIRDHDRQQFENRKALIQDAAGKLNAFYGSDIATVTLNDQYYNMGEIIEKDMRPVTLAENAFAAVDIQPDIIAVRGGTDGSKLTYMGLPTPNLFAGGENMHGRFEYVSLETMVKATEVILAIIEGAGDYNNLYNTVFKYISVKTFTAKKEVGVYPVSTSPFIYLAIKKSCFYKRSSYEFTVYFKDPDTK